MLGTYDRSITPRCLGLAGGLGRVRAELPVELRPALAPLWFFVLGTWERERMGGLIGGKLGRDAMEIRNET